MIITADSESLIMVLSAIGKRKSIAIVAIEREFKADIQVDRISFYAEKSMYNKRTVEE